VVAARLYPSIESTLTRGKCYRAPGSFTTLEKGTHKEYSVG
jgi:hypothetical protein